MKFLITLHPQVQSVSGAQPLLLDKEGSVLWVNGEALDFAFMGPDSVLPMGAITGDNAVYFIGPVKGTGDTVTLDLLYPMFSPVGDLSLDLVTISVYEDGAVDTPPTTQLPAEGVPPYEVDDNAYPVEPVNHTSGTGPEEAGGEPNESGAYVPTGN